MRLIERLYEYLNYNHVSAYAFEHACGLANGYLGKQLKGKGSVGSDILMRIKENYIDLSLVWLITGKGNMLLSPPKTNGGGIPAGYELSEEQRVFFSSNDEVIRLLQKQVQWFQTAISDKEKIIAMQQEQIRQNNRVVYKRVS